MGPERACEILLTSDPGRLSTDPGHDLYMRTEEEEKTFSKSWQRLRLKQPI